MDLCSRLIYYNYEILKLWAGKISAHNLHDNILISVGNPVRRRVLMGYYYMEKRKKKISLTVTMMLVIIGVFLIFFKNQKELTIRNDEVVVTSLYTYTSDGIIHNLDHRIRYVDTLSQNNIILCDKPNCLHERASSSNPNPTCNAVLNSSVGNVIAIYNNQLYFVESEEFSSQSLYRADVNGGNRKVIASIEDVQDTYATVASYSDNYLIYTYKNQYLLESDMLTLLEEPVVGVTIINLDTYKVTYVPTKAAYEAQIDKIHYNEGKVYYSYFYTDVKIDYLSLDYFLPENQEYRKEHSFVDIYCYDINLATDTLIYSGQYISVYDFEQDDVFLVDFSLGTEQLYMMDIINKEKKLITKEERFHSVITDGGKFIFIVKSYASETEPYYEYKYYDLVTEEIKTIGKVNESDFLSISAIIDDIIYVSFMDKINGEFCEGYIKKDEFYNANFEKIVPLVYPNRY